MIRSHVVYRGAFVVALGLALAGCGGGGGGASTAFAPPVGNPTPAPGPTPTLAPISGGFVAAQGAITKLPSSGGNFGSTVLPASTGVDFIVQAATQPAQPQGANPTLATYPVTVTDAAGLATSSVRRSLAVRASARDLETSFDVPQTRFAAFQRQMEMNRYGGSLARGVQSTTRQAQAFSVGAAFTFKILTGNITGTSSGGATSKSVPATLVAQSPHGNVWLDDAIGKNPTTLAAEFPSGQSDFTATANKFEQIYAIETGSGGFGSAFAPTLRTNYYRQCDAQGATLDQSLWLPNPDTTGASDQHINIVITDALAGSGEGGYFFSGDLLNQQALNCSAPILPSNGLQMFVMASDNYTPIANADPTKAALQYNENFWLNTDMPRTMSHEFQHLIHYMNKFVRVASTTGTGVFDDAWADEGSSMLAEDLAANGIAIDTPRFSYSFLLSPSDFSLTAFTGYQPDPLSTASNPPYGFFRNTAGSYGASYLFMRYLYDRFGSGVPSQLASSGLAGAANATAIAGESWTQLYGEWATAIAAQSTGVTTDPRYTFSSAIVLRGAVTVTSRRVAGSRTLNMAGPQPPEDFTTNPPSGYVSLTPGTSRTVNVIDGATLWFAPPGGGSGSTVRASSSAPALQGALVQGNFTQGQPSAP